MWKRAFLFLLTSSFMIVALLATCSKQDDSKTTVNVGYMGFASDIPLYVALKHGIFEKQGIEVKLTKFTAANDIVSSLIRGDISATGGIGPSTLFSFEQADAGRFKLHVFAEETGTHYSAVILVPLNSPIKSMDELAGRRIGTYTGSTQLLNVQLMLEKVFGTADAAEIVQVTPALQIGALEQGRFDALFCIEPVASTAIVTGVARVLQPNPRTIFIMNPFPAVAFAISRDFVSSNPETARKYIDAIEEATCIVQSNPEEMNGVLPAFTPITPDIAEHMNHYAWYRTGEESLSSWQKLADMFYDKGLLENKIAVDAMLWSDQ